MRRRLVVLLGGAGLAAALAAAQPADADPVCARAWVTRQSAPSTTVVDKCQPTSYPFWFDAGYEHTEPRPPGEPNGAGVSVTVSAPPV